MGDCEFGAGCPLAHSESCTEALQGAVLRLQRCQWAPTREGDISSTATTTLRGDYYYVNCTEEAPERQRDALLSSQSPKTDRGRLHRPCFHESPTVVPQGGRPGEEVSRQGHFGGELDPHPVPTYSAL